MELTVRTFKKGEYIDRHIYLKIREMIRKQLNLFVKSFIVKQVINDRYYLIDIHFDFYDTKYSSLRGSIIDIKEEKFFLVSDVFPKQEVVLSALKKTDDNTVYYRGYDGCLLRIFKLGGKIVYSTNRCVDTRNNRIFSVKDSRTFEQIMREVAGVDSSAEEEMFGFDEDKIHFFLIVTKETYLFMQGEIEERVFYIGSKYKYDVGPTKKLSFFRGFRNVKEFEPISVSEANKVLGFKAGVKDPRFDMESSGFVIKETLLPYSKTFLYSEGYYWRKYILGLKRSDKIANIYLELRTKYIGDIEKYKELFPYIERITQEGKVIAGNYPKYLTKQQLEENLINCLYLILPKTRKSEVFTLKNHIEEAIKQIARAIKENRFPHEKVYNPKIKSFLERAAAEKTAEDIERLLKEETEGELIYLMGRVLELFS